MDLAPETVVKRHWLAGMGTGLVFLAACAVPSGHSTLTLPVGGAASGPAATADPSGLAVVAVDKQVVYDETLAPDTCQLRGGGTPFDVLPDPGCTPGSVDPAVTQATLSQTICKSGWVNTIRPPESQTNKLKPVVAAAYGESLAGATELDHLVPLELGGSSAVSNLWVEPGQIPNPKDSVENRLNREVCSGQLSLAAAQALIAADWMAVP